MVDGPMFWVVLAGLAVVAGAVMRQMVMRRHWADLLVILLVGGAFAAVAILAVVNGWY